jgi:hypothetical protein
MKMTTLIGNEKGSVLTIALLILIVLTLLVIYMSRTTTTDIQVTNNMKFYNMAFYNADNGVFTSTKAIEMAYNLARTPTIPPAANPEILSFTALDNNFYNELWNFPPLDPDATNDPLINPEIEFPVDGNMVQTDVFHLGITPPPGSSGSMFGTGATSVGPKAVINLGVNSLGSGPKNSRAVISARYNHLVK